MSEQQKHIVLMILVPLLLLCVLIHCHRLLILPTHNKKFAIQTGLVRIVKQAKAGAGF